MGMDETSFQPDEEELPPEEEKLGVKEEIGAAVEHSIKSPPSPIRVSYTENDVKPATLPILETETTSPSSATSSPTRPDCKKPRLTKKTAPQGYWAEIPRRADCASFQPPAVPGMLPANVAEREWWDLKAEKKKYSYVYNILKRSNAYNAWKLSMRRRERDRLPQSWGELETDHKAQFLQWFVRSFQPHLPEVVKSWTLQSLVTKALSGRGGHWKEKRESRPRAGKQLLLTWQGPWGVIASEKVTNASGVSDATEILKKMRYAIS